LHTAIPAQHRGAEPGRAACERLRAEVDQALETLIPDGSPAELYEPARYVLAGGGKRLRPVLLLLTAGAYGVPAEAAMPAALAAEVFHNFTLVHDDIMDHAPTRRGRPTVHVRWDENTAILCGDYLMAVAYDQLARLESPRLSAVMAVFFRMVTALCEGQMLDKQFETTANVSVDEYLGMIDRKTGALVRAVLALGGLLGGATPAQLDALAEVGVAMGRAFQIQDDLLDLTSDDARWGKPIGGDLIEGKKTLLVLQALEQAEPEDADWLRRVIEGGGLEPPRVPEVRDRMRRLGVLDDAREAVGRYTALAEEALRTAVPPSPERDTLQWLIREMKGRVH
jgi:geranylgeranyl diphosphate synthase type II